jgi:2-desacetyl-2-hydroxyethyl bacteriochlorophyllide A dehydrogenase
MGQWLIQLEVAMQQVVLTGPGSLSWRDVPQPVAIQGEVLLAISRIGICGSDFHAFAGRHPAYVYPRVLGHELSGVVLESKGNEYGIKAGDRCAIDPYVNCGHCDACQMGRSNCCQHLQVLGVHRDGGMQDIVSVPPGLLHPSEKLTLDQLALVETLGIGAHAVARAGLQKGETAIVVGAGPIGLGTAIFAREAGADVFVIEKNEDRRAFAESQGWKTRLPADEIFGNVVFDATGSATVMAESLNRVSVGGRLVFVGLTSDPIQLDDALFHKREITLLASRNSVGQFPRIIKMLEEGTIQIDNWITERLVLSDLPREFPVLINRPHLIKAMVDIEPPHEGLSGKKE